MKKYVKPELFYERYELTEQIANCAWELNSAQDSCGYEGDSNLGYGGWIIIDGSIIGCDIQLTEDEGQQIYCYMNGAEGRNTFIS